MATGNCKLETDECPICLESNKELKILPCSHSFCRDCLIRLMETTSMAKCPLCCSTIVDPKYTEVKELYVFEDSLPSDQAISAMVESKKMLSRPRMCYLHSDVQAASFCLQCVIMLCQECVAAHMKMPLTSQHDIQLLATPALECRTANLQAPCSEHPDHSPELFCPSGHVIVCQVCAILQHCARPKNNFLKEAMKEYRRSLTDVETKLIIGESAFSKVIRKFEDNVIRSDRSTMATFAEINTTFNRILTSLETSRKRLKAVIKKIQSTQSYPIQKKTVAGTHKRSHIHRVRLTDNDASYVAMEPRLQKRNEPYTSWPSYTEPLPEVFWQFHSNHGRNIILTNNGCTATLNGDFNGIVMSGEPLRLNHLYEVQVNEMNPGYDGKCVLIGVVMANPQALTLPMDASLLQSAICIRSDQMCVNKLMTASDCGRALNDVRVGTRVGMMVDYGLCLHLFVDGSDQGIIYRGVKQQCYAVVDLCWSYFRKVSTLPVASIQ